MINLEEGNEIHHSGQGDFIKVAITTTSIILFSMDESGPGQETKNDLILLGYALLVISLLFDGIIAVKEKSINHDVHTNPEYKEYEKILSWEYMNCFSMWTLFFSIFGLIYTYYFTNLSKEFNIFYQNSDFLRNVILSTFFSAMGQIFIFQILDKYGPLTLSIITGVRKILSIIVSIVYFNKSLGALKMVSLALGGSVILWEVVEKSYKPVKGKIH